MFRNVEDFQKSWKAESKSTLRVFGALNDESLAQSVGGDGYTLGSLAKHVTGAALAIPAHAGMMPMPAATPALTTVAEIAAAYEQNVKQVADLVAKWSDAQLGEEVPAFGQNFKRGAILSMLISHQAHHRGQMTVLMRQAGLKVPGVYGPSESDKAAMAEKKTA
jgi:uncharacterized damage-inducible protein DinB